MKVTTLNNLKEILDSMKTIFGDKTLATKHRNTLNTYILNVDYDALDNESSVGVLGIGRLGAMTLGKES